MNKKIFNTLICIALSVAMMGMFASCDSESKGDKKGENSMNFTGRQLAILSDHGLSTDYNDLSDSQINDIMAIEDLLNYLENTYGSDVKYISFTQGSVLNDESLVAEVRGLEVTASRKYVDGKFVYEDNYKIVSSVEDYEKQIGDYFNSKNVSASVFAEIFKMKNDANDLLESVNSSNFIFVADTITHDEFKTLVSEYAEWYAAKLNGTPNTTRFYLVREVDMPEIARETYRMCVEDVPSTNRVKCVISASGKITLS